MRRMGRNAPHAERRISRYRASVSGEDPSRRMGVSPGRPGLLGQPADPGILLSDVRGHAGGHDLGGGRLERVVNPSIMEALSTFVEYGQVSSPSRCDPIVSPQSAAPTDRRTGSVSDGLSAPGADGDE